MPRDNLFNHDHEVPDDNPELLGGPEDDTFLPENPPGAGGTGGPPQGPGDENSSGNDNADPAGPNAAEVRPLAIRPVGPAPAVQSAAPTFNDVDLAGIETRNLYQFGPFSDFANALSENLPPLDAHNPAAHTFANQYLSKARETLHDVVLITPGVAGDTVAALGERSEALNLYNAKMKVFHESLTAHLSPEQRLALDKYRQVVESLTRNELTKLDILHQSARRQGSFATLIQSVGHSLLGGPRHEQAAKLHQAREQEVTTRLNKLQDIATEMRRHAGDDLWERTTGRTKAAEAKDHFEHTQNLINKVGTNTDEKGFLRRFSAITKNFADVQGQAVNASFKDALQGMMDNMNRFFKRVFEKLGFRDTGKAAKPSV